VTTETARNPREDINHGHNKYSGHGDTWTPVFHSWCAGCRAAQAAQKREVSK